MKKVIAGIVVVVLAGCAGLATPKTFDQVLAYNYGANDAALEAVTSSVAAKQAPSSLLAETLKMHDRVFVLLESARKAHNLDPMSGQGQLDLAVAALQEMQRYVRSQGVIVPEVKQ